MSRMVLIGLVKCGCHAFKWRRYQESSLGRKSRICSACIDFDRLVRELS